MEVCRCTHAATLNLYPRVVRHLSYMASALVRNRAARSASSAFAAGFSRGLISGFMWCDGSRENETWRSKCDVFSQGLISSVTYGSITHAYMASALVRHQAARSVNSAFITGAGHSAAARSKYVAASVSSAAERTTAPQAPEIPPSTSAPGLSTCLGIGLG